VPERVDANDYRVAWFDELDDRRFPTCGSSRTNREHHCIHGADKLDTFVSHSLVLICFQAASLGQVR
jgi:hypothetical protein